ncbi:hypothetical protein AFM12_18350 [Jiulongibacter sediminis]|uniref:Response regulatory domain-containing protein n=2 Tax=Jiulongibacter sediminis TaxID=1605367 RepID=A0A0P7B900_9BACT|nr:hypothetical protein AFM12_18350 [Jiulongibacter sediminis]TBX21711.1 hypothetical protein TK44_18355 [Jiulongibacter sediminis]
MLVFLVDDDPEDQEIFEMALTEAGVPVQLVCFNSAEDILDELRGLKKMPDFVFLDLNMPKINGLELLQIFSKEKFTGRTNLIIYSTSSNEKDITQARALGADEYLIKPTSFSQLVNSLKDLIEGEIA